MEIDRGLVVEEDPRVYPPSEDTLLLLSALPIPRDARVLEVGTGTGYIALHLARHARCVATDINPWALTVASRNALRNALTLDLLRTSLFEGLRSRFDLIVFNPPYLPSEGPSDWIDRAWDGGATGDDVIIPFLKGARLHLREEGRMFLLLSSHNSRSHGVMKEHFTYRKVASRKLDFEELEVYELR